MFQLKEDIHLFSHLRSLYVEEEKKKGRRNCHFKTHASPRKGNEEHDPTFKVLIPL